MFKNPDTRKYVIRVRRGKAILVDKQILRWRKRRKASSQETVKEEPAPKDVVDRIKKLF